MPIEPNAQDPDLSRQKSNVCDGKDVDMQDADEDAAMGAVKCHVAPNNASSQAAELVCHATPRTQPLGNDSRGSQDPIEDVSHSGKVSGYTPNEPAKKERLERQPDLPSVAATLTEGKREGYD